MKVIKEDGVVYIIDKDFYAALSEETYNKLLQEKDNETNETIFTDSFDSILRSLQHSSASQPSNIKLGRLIY